LSQSNEKPGRFGLNSTQSTTQSKESFDENAVNELIQNSQKADVFAFGVVLWEILTRQIPWNNSSYQEIQQFIRFLFFFFSFFSFFS